MGDKEGKGSNRSRYDLVRESLRKQYSQFQVAVPQVYNTGQGI